MRRTVRRTVGFLLLGTLALLAVLVKSGLSVGLSVILAVVALALALRVWGFVVLRRRPRRPH